MGEERGGAYRGGCPPTACFKIYTTTYYCCCYYSSTTNTTVGWSVFSSDYSRLSLTVSGSGFPQEQKKNFRDILRPFSSVFKNRLEKHLKQLLMSLQ